ncbi:MAG: M1 family peptidase, partial [Bacteroidetes bacterium]|nr:M1 family peptidase [Bacteroidota bacterium]
MKKILLFVFVCLLLTHATSLVAQPDRWQQRIKYTINVNMDVVTNRMNGIEKIVYTNNSPDTLNKI